MELVSAASYNMLLYDTNENNKYFAAIWLHALPNMCITDPKCFANFSSESAHIILIIVGSNNPTGKLNHRADKIRLN